jgi:hypothetical protein
MQICKPGDKLVGGKLPVLPKTAMFSWSSRGTTFARQGTGTGLIAAPSCRYPGGQKERKT